MTIIMKNEIMKKANNNEENNENNEKWNMIMKY